VLGLHQEHLLLSREYLASRGVELSTSEITTVLRVRGPLQRDAVDKAMHALAGRHPALRMVAEPSAVPADERARRLDELGRTGVFEPGLYEARVTGEPQFSWALDREGEEHLLRITVDHLVADAVSMKLIRRETAALLTATPLARLPETYPVEAHAGALAYWVHQWNEFSAARVGFDDLPFALPRPNAASYSFGTVSAVWDAGAIRVAARRARVTLYVFLLAAFARTLRGCTGKAKLGVWCHFANRPSEESRNAVGWYAHTHLLGIDTEQANLPLHCREVVARAAEHQAVPVMRVWRALGAYPQDPDAKVLLDVSAADDPLPHGNSLTIEHAPELSPPAGRFAGLGIYVRDQGDSLALSVQYLEDRFPRAAIEQLLADFQKQAAC
jgi:hypothetical protein